MFVFDASQCTYRCVVLPDTSRSGRPRGSTSLNAPTGVWCSLTRARGGTTGVRSIRLNAPTGAWCSLTMGALHSVLRVVPSQCTYRCVVLPDFTIFAIVMAVGLTSQCTYRCVVLPDEDQCPTRQKHQGLNAPTGAWCSLTPARGSGGMTPLRGPGAPPAPGAPLRTGQHRAQSST